MTDTNLVEEVWISCPKTLTKNQRRMMSGILRDLNEICHQTKCSFFGYFEEWYDDLCDDDVTEDVLKIGAQMD